MTALDVTRINIYAPYKVWSDGDEEIQMFNDNKP